MICPEVIFLAVLAAVDLIAIFYSTYRYYNPKEGKLRQRDAEYDEENLD
ncbi:MAG: hypothetical protein Q4A32_03470 [Lachnospiraceae bacterium]|nr:hypothetical protein [Lachnospiraceae bacterium]